MKAFKKSICIILCLLLLQCTASAYTTSSKTPVCAEEAELKWSLKLGTNYKNAPSELTICDDTIVVMSANKLLKIDKSNGQIIQSVVMSGHPSFGSAPVLCSNGKIFCPLDGGMIEAFDFESLTPLWCFDSGNDELQALTEIVESDGLLYTGFWQDEDVPSDYVCINSENGELVWAFRSQGGFYRARCLVIDSYVLFGSDDGEIDSNGSSFLRCLDKRNGSIICSLETIGDIRSGLAFCNGSIYFGTKGGYLYNVAFEGGELNLLKKRYLGGEITSTPEICSEKIYIGVQTTGFSGNTEIVNCNDLSTLCSVKMLGYPQNEVLLTTAYDDVYVYSTYNSLPGGIAVIRDGANGSDITAEDLFVPEAAAQNHCINRITADNEGTLYYKNDSGTIFAIGKKQKKKTFFDKIKDFFANMIKLLKSLFKGDNI